jgi:branched-chain amino acid transport system substrate-binding protein
MNVATPASLIYQVNGILFITPGGTSSKLARRGLKLVFNSYPGEHEISDTLVDYCSSRKYQHIAFIYQNTPYGIESTASFEQHAGEKGLDIVARLPYDRPDVRVIRDIVDHFQITEPPDAIFVVGLMPGVAQVIAGIRRLGVTQPILATEDVDDDQYLQIAGSAAEGTVIPSAFPLNSPRPEVADFAQRFQALHHKPPSSWAAQGYDAVKLLAFAVQSANSADPTMVADALRQIRDWPGVTGLHTFNTEGEVVGKTMVLKQVQNGRFVFLEEAASAGGGQ